MDGTEAAEDGTIITDDFDEEDYETDSDQDARNYQFEEYPIQNERPPPKFKRAANVQVPTLAADYDSDEDMGTLRDATMFGITTDGVNATKKYNAGEVEEEAAPQQAQAPPPPNAFQRLQQKIAEPLFKDKFKVTAKMAEEGRKIMREKVEGVETAKKSAILNRILNYYTHFPYVKEKAIRKKLTIETQLPILVEEELRIKRELSQSNAFEALKHLDNLATWSTELLLINTFSVPANGLAEFSKSAQFMVEQELKELSIEYGDYLTAGPEFRYMMKFMQRIFVIIRRNQSMGMGSMATNEINQVVRDQLQKDYQDL